MVELVHTTRFSSIIFTSTMRVKRLESQINLYWRRNCFLFQSSSPGASGVHVVRSLVYCSVTIVYRFALFRWAIDFSVPLPFTYSENPFVVLKPFMVYERERERERFVFRHFATLPYYSEYQTIQLRIIKPSSHLNVKVKNKKSKYMYVDM